MKKTEVIAAGNVVGEKYEFKTKISITDDGEFRCTFPEELVPFAEMLKNAKTPVRDMTTSRVMYIARYNEPRVAGPVLKDCIQVLKNMARMHLAMDVKRELVLLYHADTLYSVFQFPDGSLEPNGRSRHKDKASEGGKWLNGSRHYGSEKEPVSLAIAADIRVKITRTRGEKIDIEYGYVVKGDEFYDTIGDEGRELQRYNMRCKPEWNYTGVNDKVCTNELPYSEKAAMFFHQLMWQASMLCMMVNGFFDNKDKLNVAIESAKVLQLGVGNGS